jgi:hypothetical protein
VKAHPDGLIEAKRLGTPGQCLFCEGPIAPRKKLLCSSKSCVTAYYRAWHRDAAFTYPERYRYRRRAA